MNDETMKEKKRERHSKVEVICTQCGKHFFMKYASNKVRTHRNTQ